MKGKGHGHMIKLLWGDLLLETSWSSWFTIENKSPLSTFTKHLHILPKRVIQSLLVPNLVLVVLLRTISWFR